MPDKSGGFYDCIYENTDERTMRVLNRLLNDKVWWSSWSGKGYIGGEVYHYFLYDVLVTVR